MMAITRAAGMLLSVAALALVACAAAPFRGVAGQPQAPAGVVRYTVALPNPQTQTAEMAMEIQGVQTPTLDVALPVWRPGRYVVLDPATTISRVRAEDAGGRPLGVEKTDKSTWRVITAGAATVRFRYRVYANSLNDRTRHIDSTHAFLSPSSVFVYAPSRRSCPLRVSVDAPAGWRTATGLAPVGDHEYAAANYDVLVDSPLEIGIHDRHVFDVDGVPHEIDIWHAGCAESAKPEYDADALTRDVAKIVRAEAAVFGEMPYDRYVFLVHSGPGLGGGTEHLNSTIMQTARSSFEDAAGRKRFLGLVAHEMFHTWNVKQLRPAGLKPYDYEHENYTDLLWVAEGTTSYYSGLCRVRAGLLSADDYLGTLAGMIEGELNKVGWDEQSLAESSFDAWVKFNKPWPDNVNTTMSFYSKGALVSMLLDMELRARTGGRVSLDTVMREMYRRFPLDGPGYTTGDLVSVVNDLSGSDFGAFFRDFVSGTVRPDVTSMMRVVGLDCRPTTRAGEPYLGINLAAKEGRVVVTGVLADGPAYSAGINADDEVVALNGRRLGAADLDARLRKMKPGDEATFTLIRRDELRTIRVTLAEGKHQHWTIRRVENPTDAQREAYRSWLGVDW